MTNLKFYQNKDFHAEVMQSGPREPYRPKLSFKVCADCQTRCELNTTHCWLCSSTDFRANSASAGQGLNSASNACAKPGLYLAGAHKPAYPRYLLYNHTKEPPSLAILAHSKIPGVRRGLATFSIEWTYLLSSKISRKPLVCSTVVSDWDSGWMGSAGLIRSFAEEIRTIQDIIINLLLRNELEESKVALRFDRLTKLVSLATSRGYENEKQLAQAKSYQLAYSILRNGDNK